MIDEGYAHIGALLREAREDRHLTLDYASKQLHIRTRYLQALEDGRISELPGLAYAKGYLQAYAVFLELDKHEVIRRFENMEGMLSRQGFFFPEVFSKDKRPGSRLVYGALGAAFLVYIGWITLFSPEQQPISVIDTPQTLRERMRISALMTQDVPCLARPDVLYPPCYLKSRVDQWLILPRSQSDTIMRLAEPS